jgi:hypothetical protein
MIDTTIRVGKASFIESLEGIKLSIAICFKVLTVAIIVDRVTVSVAI